MGQVSGSRPDEHGAAQIEWTKVERWRTWSQLSEGAYVLRTNVRDWSDEELWRAYTQLTDAEAADLVTFLKEGLASASYPAHTAPELPK